MVYGGSTPLLVGSGKDLSLPSLHSSSFGRNTNSLFEEEWRNFLQEDARLIEADLTYTTSPLPPVHLNGLLEKVADSTLRLAKASSFGVVPSPREILGGDASSGAFSTSTSAQAEAIV